MRPASSVQQDLAPTPVADRAADATAVAAAVMSIPASAPASFTGRARRHTYPKLLSGGEEDGSGPTAKTAAEVSVDTKPRSFSVRDNSVKAAEPAKGTGWTSPSLAPERRRALQDPLTFPPILGVSDHARTPTPTADTPIEEKQRVKILPAEATKATTATTATTTAATAADPEQSVNDSRRETQSARKVLKFAELNSVSLPSSRESRSAAGISSSCVASRQSLPPLSPHATCAELPRITVAARSQRSSSPPLLVSGEEKEQESNDAARAVESTAELSTPSAPSLPRCQNVRQRNSVGNEEVEDRTTGAVVDAAAAASPPHPFPTLGTHIPLSSSPPRQPSFAPRALQPGPCTVADASAPEYYMGVNFSLAEGTEASVEKESGNATPFKVSSPAKDVKDQPFVTRPSLLGAEAAPAAQPSHRSARDGSRVAAPVTLPGIPTAPSSPASSSSSPRRESDGRRTAMRGSKTSMASFSLFPPPLVARSARSTSSTARASAELTQPFRRRRARLREEKATRDVSTSAFEAKSRRWRIASPERAHRARREGSDARQSSDAQRSDKPLSSSSSQDVMDSYTKLLYLGWSCVSGDGANSAAVAKDGHGREKNNGDALKEAEDDSVKVDGLASDTEGHGARGRGSVGEPSFENSRSVVELTSIVASAPLSNSGDNDDGGDDEDEYGGSGHSTTSPVRHNHTWRDHATTFAPSPAVATLPLRKPQQKRHERRVFLASSDGDGVPQRDPAMGHSSPRVMTSVAAEKSINSSASFSAYYTAATASTDSSPRSRLGEVSAEVAAGLRQPQQQHQQQQRRYPSFPSPHDSDSVALSFLERSVSDVASASDRSDAAEAPEDDAHQANSFSIGSDFADFEQAALDRCNYESLWSCSGSDSEESSGHSNDGRSADEGETKTILKAAHESESAGEGALADSDEGRRRRLLPVSNFRHYYIPEGYITESRISATYKVRERCTRRHFAATFVLHDPGDCGDAAVEAAGTTPPQPSQLMSLDLLRFCAMSLLLQHPNLIQTFDVFYRTAQDAEQLHNLVHACTGAGGDAVLTWTPQIEKPSRHVRSRPTVSLRLPAVPVAASVASPQRSTTSAVSVVPPGSVARRSSSLHSVEESHRSRESPQARKSRKKREGEERAKKCRSPTTPKSAGQYGSGHRLLRLLPSLFGSGCGSSENSSKSTSPSKGNACRGNSAKKEEGDGTVKGNSSSGTVPGFQWPAEVAAELASRERRVAELRGSRTSEGRAKAAERRARIERLAILLVSGRVVTVLISELVQDDDTVQAPASLWEAAQRGRGLPETQLMAVTRGIADALHYLHSFRAPCLAIVHGAVEPCNVVLDTNGVVKLVNYASMHWCLFEGEGGKSPGKNRNSATRGRSNAQDLQQLLKGSSHASRMQETAADMYGLGRSLLTLSSGIPLSSVGRLFVTNAFLVSNPSLQSLLRGLLAEKPAARMTAEAVLRHPFVSSLASSPPSSGSVQKL
ncbi:hypothetical protein ABB37_05333 [Leptomonas pyrrhocoris]|uniref:Protein kinase domain-containing protein n=1 Tax=Leptomonas pyrrhocoris TaxID=157538 RepID=A0A0M9G064_LEPPY|nr:hypothetical protein ABB37_05333 [Leptomonas pyrrhocoris]KPA79509.1 hypothetical protein ABB37_05333 [Leptomonas pyrrhocoris]|eukprot:XP_015657948.1 hypothetical protein ABB37_05333 [Leptomonas pyrrhocoris]